MLKLLWFTCLVCMPAWPRQEPAMCGTHAQTSREELFLHRKSAARHPRSLASLSTNRDYGNIVVIDDSGGVIGRRNPFDLNQKTLAFQPTSATAAAYTFQLSDPSYDQSAETGATLLPLKDDDSILVAIPFDFPYFGTTYRQIFVNSDGNLTFGQGDSASADRSLGRFNSGPPRIAPLYTDLDPSSSRRGVLLNTQPDRMVFSWAAVPAYSSNGSGIPQTFQIRLYPTGRIEITWSDINLTDAVVGISPGALRETPTILSFLAGSTEQYSASIAERFSGSDSLDIVTAAQRFYQTHEDSYDYLVFFNSEGVQAAPGAVAYEVTVRNSRTGYGDTAIDDGVEYASPTRLQSVLNMGPTYQYPSDPNAPVPLRGSTGDTTLTVLGHETGHLFLAYASVNDSRNPQAQPMLGRALVHWSFLYDSEASLLEGNRIQDNGSGVSPRFRTVATVQGYSPLDQYLMGFRTPDEVPPTFLVANPNPPLSAATAPQRGIAFDGDRRDVAIREIIDNVGPRVPDSTVSQRQFRFAFILVVPTTTTPDPTDIAKLERYRSEYAAAYQGYTSNRATADLGLKNAIHLSVFPAAGIVAGTTGIAKITLDHPSASPLTCNLRSEVASISQPATVTIPAGQQSISFPITGVTPGVVSLTVEPLDGTYETPVARIQVSPASAVLLNLISGADPVLFQATDSNRLPYPGLQLSAQVTTDLAGLATLTNASQTLSLPGLPAPQFGAVVGLAAGGIATVYAANLNNPSVAINGETAAILYSDQNQINFEVPADIPAGTATLIIQNGTGSAAVIPGLPVTALQSGTQSPAPDRRSSPAKSKAWQTAPAGERSPATPNPPARIQYPQPVEP